MYQDTYAINYLPQQCLTTLNDLHPKESSELEAFLKNTMYLHDLNKWVYENRNTRSKENKKRFNI